MSNKKKNNNISTLFLYLKLLKKWGKNQKSNFLLANLLMIFVAISTAMYPIVIDFAINTISDKKLKNFVFVPIFIIGLTVLKSFSYFYQTLLVGKIANEVIRLLQQKLYTKLINFDILILNKYNTGSLQSRFINDLNVLKEAIIRTLNNLVRDLFTLLGLVISMLYLDWVLTLSILVIYPLCIKPIIIIGKITRKNSLKLQEKVSDTASFLNESFSSIRVIKTFNLEKRQEIKAENKFHEIYKSNIDIIRTRAKIEPTLEIVGGIAISIVLVLAGYRILAGHSDIGSFTGFISALLIAVQPARALGTLNAILQEGAASLQRLDDLSKRKNNVKNPKNPKEIKFPKGSIIFKNVTFSYDKTTNVLDKFNCKIKAGEEISIVGENGSGKSTFINLIPRLFDPVKGSVFIDRINTKDLRLRDLRSLIALVSQDIILFDCSIEENILLANNKASKKDIINSCILADAHNFIRNLKDGYDTIVGEKGYKLSGGQRQKISIARAILKKPKILLLDEATSSLDNISETNVNNSIKSISSKITTITIAHRVNTIINSKRVLFFNNGKIEGDGNHYYLIKSNHNYKKLFKRSFLKNN